MIYTKLKIIALSGAMALGIALLGTASVSAAPMTGIKAGAPAELGKYNLVEKASHKRWHRRSNRRRHRRRHRRRNNFLLGVGAAALIGGVIAAGNNAYTAPRRRYYAPSRRPNLRPWSNAWYSYCSRKFRSFNPRTGYYNSYNRGPVFCLGGGSAPRPVYQRSQAQEIYNQPAVRKSWEVCVQDTIDADSTDRADECPN